MAQPPFNLIKCESPIPGPDFHLLDVRLAFEDEPKPLSFVIPGLLARTVGSLVAAGGVGKSSFALELAATVAGGPDLLDLQALDKEWQRSSGKVVFLSGEDPAEILVHRLHAIGKHLKPEEKKTVSGNLVIAPLSGFGIDVMSHDWKEWIIDLIDGASLIIIDTLRRFHTGSENDDAEMSAILRFFEYLCREHGVTVLFLHHTNKGSYHNGTGDAQQASRGTSVITDNSRYQSNLIRMSEVEAKEYGVADSCRRNFVRWAHPKQNYSAPMKDHWYRRHEGGVLKPAVLESQHKQFRSMKSVSGVGSNDEQW